MKTVVAHSAEWSGAKAQRITNMEKLAPGFASLVETRPEPADMVTLVLAPNQRIFKDWHRQQQRQVGGPLPRVRRVTGVRDLQGYAPDSVEIVELPDWKMSMPYDEGQRVEQMLEALPKKRVDPPWVPDESGPLAGRNASGRKVPLQSSSNPSMSRSRLITVECVGLGGDIQRVTGTVLQKYGLMRVRIGRTKERKGDVGGYPLDVVTTQYLDGKALRVASTKQYFQEDEVAFDAVPARTKDITDFGRLTTAAKALAVSMAPYGPDNEPSSEQLAVFINGYRNLLEWRRRVRQQMTQAEGEIDAVETLLTQIL
jgi:hypothetical protein